MIDSLDLAIERIEAGTGAMRVATSTLLPSGALVTVTIRPEPSGTFSLSDEGAGRDDLHSLGHLTTTSGDTIRGNAIAERFGLAFDDGVFMVRAVSGQQLAAAIVFVAEAARQWTSRTAEKAVRRAEAAIVDRIEDRIRKLVPGIHIDRERELPGLSGKRHRFDLVAQLDGERHAVFEVVSPSTNALSSTYMKLDDLRQEHEAWPREVITREIDAWSAADMVLLSHVATGVQDVNQDWSSLVRRLQ